MKYGELFELDTTKPDEWLQKKLLAKRGVTEVD